MFCQNNLINFAKFTRGVEQKISEFEAKYAMTHPVGCIDGTYVPILCPSKNSEDYY